MQNERKPPSQADRAAAIEHFLAKSKRTKEKKKRADTKANKTTALALPVAIAEIDRDAHGFPIIRNQRLIDNRYQITCPVCTSKNAYMRVRRARTETAHHYYVVQCADCETFSHLKTDRAVAAYRAWNAAMQNPQIQAQIRGMLATFIATAMQEDETRIARRNARPPDLDMTDTPEYSGEDILDLE